MQEGHEFSLIFTNAVSVGWADVIQINNFSYTSESPDFRETTHTNKFLPWFPEVCALQNKEFELNLDLCLGTVLDTQLLPPLTTSY